MGAAVARGLAATSATRAPVDSETSAASPTTLEGNPFRPCSPLLTRFTATLQTPSRECRAFVLKELLSSAPLGQYGSTVFLVSIRGSHSAGARLPCFFD